MKKSAILLAMLTLLASCSIGGSSSSNETVQPGDTISVNYTGRLQDGTIFDSSYESDAKLSKNYDPKRTYEPLSFTVGE